MKTVIYILICALTLSFSNSLIARETDSSKFIKLPKEVKKVLSSKMEFPAKAKKLGIEGKVSICFKITPSGIIKINCIDGHPILVEGVKKELNELEFPKKLAYANKNMLIKYNFKKE